MFLPTMCVCVCVSACVCVCVCECVCVSVCVRETEIFSGLYIARPVNRKVPVGVGPLYKTYVTLPSSVQVCVYVCVCVCVCVCVMK